MATTYSVLDNWSVKALCTTGSETAPTTSATDGLNLATGTAGNDKPVARYEVRVYPTTGGTALTAGTLDFYCYDRVQAKWQKLLNTDGTQVKYTVPAALGNDNGVSFPAFEANGADRVTCIPTGLGVACTISIIGTGKFP